MKDNITPKELERIVRNAGRKEKLTVTPGGVTGTYLASTATKLPGLAMVFVVTFPVGKPESKCWRLWVDVRAISNRSEAARSARRFAAMVKARVAGRRIRR